MLREKLEETSCEREFGGMKPLNENCCKNLFENFLKQHRTAF